MGHTWLRVDVMANAVVPAVAEAVLEAAEDGVDCLVYKAVTLFQSLLVNIRSTLQRRINKKRPSSLCFA